MINSLMLDDASECVLLHSLKKVTMSKNNHVSKDKLGFFPFFGHRENFRIKYFEKTKYKVSTPQAVLSE